MSISYLEIIEILVKHFESGNHTVRSADIESLCEEAREHAPTDPMKRAIHLHKIHEYELRARIVKKRATSILVETYKTQAVTPPPSLWNRMSSWF
jgi:hypothetical protein